MTSLMTSLLRTAVDSRHIAEKRLVLAGNTQKRAPPIAVLHIYT